jgi:hypothetical protein
MYIILIVLVWILPWKGYALWTAATRREKAWFVFLMLPINTLALLDIFYIFSVAKRKPKDIKDLVIRTAQSTHQKAKNVFSKKSQ